MVVVAPEILIGTKGCGIWESVFCGVVEDLGEEGVRVPLVSCYLRKHSSTDSPDQKPRASTYPRVGTLKRIDFLHQARVEPIDHGPFELSPSGVRRIEHLFLWVRLVARAVDRRCGQRTKGDRCIGGTLMNRKFLAPALYYSPE